MKNEDPSSVRDFEARFRRILSARPGSSMSMPGRVLDRIGTRKPNEMADEHSSRILRRASGLMAACFIGLAVLATSLRSRPADSSTQDLSSIEDFIAEEARLLGLPEQETLPVDSSSDLALLTALLGEDWRQ